MPSLSQESLSGDKCWGKLCLTAADLCEERVVLVVVLIKFEMRGFRDYERVIHRVECCVNVQIYVLPYCYKILEPKHTIY